MKPSTRQRKPFNYTILGFLIPFLAMLTFMIINQAHPFGNKSLLYSDGYHQYFPFFKEFRRALLSGDSLLYSWNVGMGVDYLGLIAYYLASPLNLFSVLIPESMLLSYFSLLTPIRLGFAGLFFSIFLKNVFKKNDISVPLFGSFYGLCAWSLGYSWNVMWLDTFALLPLVALGTYSLLKEKKIFLYTVSLYLSVFSNYYIGFFTCIFVLLTFLCYQICRWECFKKLLDDFLRIGLCSVIAIGMTAILTIPTFAALKTTQSSVNEYPKTFQMNIVKIDEYKDDIYNNWDQAKTAWESGSKAQAVSLGFKSVKAASICIFEGMKQVAGHSTGGTSINFKEADALPNIYCGVITLIFSFLFITCGQIKLRDKLCSVFLLIFLSLSFLIRQLDYIWHGFHFTNMIPYRFSFVYSFVMLYMAYRAYTLRKFFKPWQVIASSSLAIIYVLISNSFKNFINEVSIPGFVTGLNNSFATFDFSTNSVQNLTSYLQVIFYPAFNFLFILCTSAFLLISSLRFRLPDNVSTDIKKAYIRRFRKRQQVSSVLTACLIGLELILNMANYSLYWSGASVSNYPKGAEHSENLINLMHEKDTSLFYRTETSHAQILNDGALNNYNGISTFTSSANVSITRFMKNLGYGAKETYNRYCFETSSPVPELFLNLKYLIDRDGYFYEGPIIRTNAKTDEKYTDQKEAYENPYYDLVASSSLCAIAENNAYLPLGFLCDEEFPNFNFENNDDRYVFENLLISSATGEDFTLWNQVSGSFLSITGDENVNVVSRNAYGYCRYNAQQNGKVTYAFTADREGLMCLDISQGKRNGFSVWLNNNHDSRPDERIFTESYSLPQTISACKVKPGDIVEVQFDCKKGESARIEVYAAIIDETEFRKAYNILSKSTLNVTAFSNTRIEGIIDCAQDGFLYTSVPQNGTNWKLYVDGKETKAILIGDVMMGVHLSKGLHNITFRYENKAFVIGCIITTCSLVAFAVLCILYYKPCRKYPLFLKNIKKMFRPTGKYDK